MIEKSILSSNIIIHYVTNFVNNEIIILNEVFFMKEKIIYWITALATIFPLIIIPIPIWLSVILAVMLFLLTMFLPIISTIAQTIFWIWGLIVIFTRSIDFVSVIAFIFLALWIFSTVSYFYYNHKTQ